MIPEVLQVISEQWRVLAGLLFFIAWGQAVLAVGLRALLGDRLASWEYWLLGLSGWSLPVLLFSAFWLGLLRGLPNALIWAGCVILLLGLALRAPRLMAAEHCGMLWPLLGLGLTSLGVRLDFLAGAVLPSYFDSAQHYSLIQEIQGAGLTGSLGSAAYYHRAYHLLAACLASLLQADIAQTMLVLGQLVLAFMPFALFVPVRRLSGSGAAALFTVALAGFGWYMPAHAANWGKYPALFSLALLPFVLILGVLVYTQPARSAGPRWLGYGWWGLTLLGLVLFHSRAVIVLGLCLLAIWIAAWQRHFSGRGQAIVFMAVLALVGGEIVALQRQPIYGPLFDPYFHKGLWITGLVLALTFCALRDRAPWVLAALLTMGFWLGCLFVPVTVPGYGALTLLDRPLVEMLLYLPLSALGGLGLASLEAWLSGVARGKLLRWEWLSAGLSVLILMHALAVYEFHPSDCCVLAGPDDLAVLDWLRSGLDTEARVAIAVNELNVLPSPAVEGYSGSDAGIWITPLTGLTTVPLFYSSDFGQVEIHAQLCQAGAGQLYVGGHGQPFSQALVQTQPDWYRLLFAQGQSAVYAVVGCP